MPFIPYHDENPLRDIPYCTWGLILVNVLVFAWELTVPDKELHRLFLEYSVVPARLMAEPVSLGTFLDVLRSMFLHGGLGHLFGNVFFMFLFADNVEDTLGRPLFLAMYLLCGFIAAYMQSMFCPTATEPMIGASGAISGMLGCYMVLFPGVQVRCVVFLYYFLYRCRLPALVFIGGWFVIQLFQALAGLAEGIQGGVAFFAHVGGFVVGAALTWLLDREFHFDTPSTDSMVSRQASVIDAYEATKQLRGDPLRARFIPSERRYKHPGDKP